VRENLIYLDTNIYSNLSKSHTLFEISELRNRILEKGERPVISPINILEILATKNDQLRENIIMVCQHLCDPEMLAEPEALIIDFIASKKQQKCTDHLVLEDQFSKSDLAETWREVQSDKNRTLLISETTLSQLDSFKTLQAFFHAYYSRGNRLPDLRLPKSSSLESFTKSVIYDTLILRKDNVPDPRVAVLCENRSLITLTILCAGLSPFPQAINEFWDAMSITSVDERYAFVKKNLGFLSDSGPIIGLGSFMGWQATKGHDNGNFYDCLHFSYLPYVKHFYTDDHAFHGFVSAYPQAKILKGILTSENLLH